MNHAQSSLWPYWVVLAIFVVAVLLCFRPVRVWLRGVYLFWRGVVMARKAEKYVEYQRVGQSLDLNYGYEKSRYKTYISKACGHWSRWTLAPLEKRVETLKARFGETEKQQEELEEKLEAEKANPPRQRARVRDGFYYPAAALLFIADIGFTYLCVQVLGLSPLFIFPMAVILGGAGWFLGDALGKGIEPESAPRNDEDKRRHQNSTYLLISASVVICAIVGTIRFSYTQHELNTNLGVDLVSSYGILIAILLASVVLGWLHQGATTEELLAAAKARKARYDLLIKRANRTGSRATEAFQSYVMALQSESEEMRSRFHDGFDRTWKGRAPRGVQTPSSPLEGVDTILKGLVWPPSDRKIQWPDQDVEHVDLGVYIDPYVEQAANAQTSARPPVAAAPQESVPSRPAASPRAVAPQPRIVELPLVPGEMPPPPTIG